MDFTAILAQKQLRSKSNGALSTQLADTAIAIAFRMERSPHEILRIGAENVGFTEQEWRDEVLPELRRAFEPDPETKAKREAAIAACPTPVYHETHRYCPSCPWTEDDNATEIGR